MIKQFTLSRLFLFSAYHCFMKELMIVRHAKSSWEDDSLSDFERPLNERGQTEALSMAQQAAMSEWRPDLIVCSNGDCWAHLPRRDDVNCW
jgi:hypothetical protein